MRLKIDPNAIRLNVWFCNLLYHLFRLILSFPYRYIFFCKVILNHIPLYNINDPFPLKYQITHHRKFTILTILKSLGQ